jgi:hypothetical protein
MENEISECRKILDTKNIVYKIFLDKSENINSNKEFVCFQILENKKTKITNIIEILEYSKILNKEILINYNVDFGLFECTDGSPLVEVNFFPKKKKKIAKKTVKKEEKNTIEEKLINNI